MVVGSAVLARNPVLPTAQDYAALKAEAVAAVQRLCPSWTDFNAHDPGLTLIELLCFALTDLGYRVGLPLEELLGSGVQDLVRPALFAAPPVSIEDFRRLLLDQVEGLGNLWLRPRGNTGLHDIRLHPQLPLPGVHPGSRPSYRRLIERARRVWERHRPLCEDIGSIRVLQPRRVVVRARVRIDHGARAETVLAHALFRVALTLAPEPRRTALDETTYAGLLFEGPLLLNEPIAPVALSEKPAVIDSDTVWERIADLPGVLGVDDLHLWVEGVGDCARFATGPDEYCCLDGGFEEAAMPIAVERDGRNCTVDRGEVLRQLIRLWSAHRGYRTSKGSHHEPSERPVARPRHLRAFAALGPQLPRIYGLTSGMPETPDARQLHGFLALFEGQMRRFCERLGDVEAVGAERGSAIEPRWLDLLLALRGVAPPLALPVDRQAAAKAALLQAHGTLARRRGRGFDPKALGEPWRLAGPELRMRLMLGSKVRITLVEHVMLRARSGGRRAVEDGDHRHGMTVSAVVAGAEADRAQVTAMLRDEVPAHIGLEVHFVDRPRWRRFYHVHRLWRSALRLDELQSADDLAIQLRDMLEGWAA